MEKFNPVTHVIFDCDGLLLNTEDIYGKVDAEVIARYGKEYPISVRRKVLGIPGKNAAEIIVKELELPLTAEQYHTSVLELSIQRLSDAELMPGVSELIQNLFKAKVPMAIATSSSADTFRLKMSKHKDFLDKYFSHVVCAATDAEVKRGKPAPDVFLVCSKRFPDSPPPSKCLVIEDSPNGIIGAKEAGMQTVIVPASYIPEDDKKLATISINSMTEFKPEWFHLPSIK